MANVSEINRGMVINWKNDLWAIQEFQHVSPGKGSAFTRIKLKNLSSQKVVENTFKAMETLDFVDVARKQMQYLYGNDSGATFMDMVSFEQIEIDNETLSDAKKYLKEGLEIVVAMHGEQPITVDLPKKIEYTITSTEPAVKGDTVSGNVQKNAEADNGMQIRVPIFIKEGDKVLINTDTGAYSERVN